MQGRHSQSRESNGEMRRRRVAAVASATGAVDVVCLRFTAHASTITSEGSTGFCTGTLLNPSDGSFTPYFLSAAHCISTQSAASSLSTYWFYEKTGCGTGGVNTSAVQVPGGATLLYANVANDFSFMQIGRASCRERVSPRV